MSAFLPKGRSIYECMVPTSSGWVKCSTKTRDKNTARKIDRMVKELGPTGLRALDLLDKVRDGALSLPTLWDLWVRNERDLVAIRERLDDTDLLVKRTPWLEEVKTHASRDTAEHYAHYLKSFVEFAGLDGSLPRTHVRVETVKAWLASLTVRSGTKRKYHAGISSFLGFCVSVGALQRNPMRDVKAPPAGKARDRHLAAEEAARLAHAQPSPYRELSALLAGTGIEVSVALALRVRDVDTKHQEIRARGTKSHNRDRIAKVATWAWPSVAKAIANKLPDALIFDTIPNRWEAQQHHSAACSALGITGYTMRDARHSWAVRMARAGVPIEQISKQLGHKDAVMALRVYAVYAPTQAERAHWEEVATARDAAHAQVRQ